ncbi:MAG TPA: choice-of-anchor tandem repeat NxxGxxAF-containing protein [Tepidisphaeraceae bacterium]
MTGRAGWRAIGLASCAVVAPLAPVAQAQYAHPFILTGQQPNGAPDGMLAFFFNPTRDLIINQNDQVLTQLVLYDPSNTNHTEVALYSGTSAASFNLLARAGQEVAGNPGVFPKLFGTFAISNQGTIAVGADLQGPGTTTADNLGFFMGDVNSGLTMIARKGGPVPDLPPTITHRSFFFPSVNSSGLLTVGLILGGATNSANDTGIYLRRPGAADFETFIRESAPTPDVPAQTFGQATLTRLNEHDDILAITGLAGAGIGTGNDSAIWSGSTNLGLLARVAQTGNPAPGLDFGIQYASFSAQAFTENNTGAYAFRSTLSSVIAGQVTTANDNAIYVGRRGKEPTLLVREGDPAPIPGATNVNYSGTLGLALGGNGLVVFSSDLSNRSFLNNSGIFAGTTPTNVAAIALESQRAPGTPAGSTFYNDLSSSSAFSGISVNDKGQIVFLATVKYPGQSTGTTNKGLFVYDPVQGIICLGRTGGTIDVNGQAKTIKDLLIGQTGNGEDGQGSPFNNNGTIVFQASGADFTGIFTTRVPLIGDVNLDGKVSFADFQTLELGFGLTDADRAIGDLNGDQLVDIADFKLLYNHYGDSIDGSAAVSPIEMQALNTFAASVPEPAGLTLLLATCATLRRRRT